MKPRLVFIPGLLLLGPGCAFFGVEESDCLPNEECSAAVGDGDGDLPGDGDGDGDVMSGGTPGDGDGDVGSGGGDGDVASGGDAMGGTSGGGDRGSGGSGGTGGAPDGGSGGVPTGGSGGDPMGGTGGAPDGGSGGMPSGGTGGMGSGGAVAVARELQINEVHEQFVEIYFVGYQETSFDLSALRIIIDGNSTQECQLTGGSVDETNRYFVAQIPDAACFDGSACVSGCSFPSLTNDSVVTLQVLIGGIYQEVDTVGPFSDPMSSSQSYQAVPVGTGDLVRRSPPTAGRDVE